MNLTLKETLDIYTQLGNGTRPTVVSVIVHNLMVMKDTAQARAYLEKVFRNELWEVTDVSDGMVEFCELLQLMIRVNVKRFEGMEKPTGFRNYLAHLMNVSVGEFLRLLKIEVKHEEDEWVHLKEAASELDCSVKTITRHAKTGKLRGTRDKSNRLLVSRRSIIEFRTGNQ